MLRSSLNGKQNKLGKPIPYFWQVLALLLRSIPYFTGKGRLVHLMGGILSGLCD